MRIQNAAVDLEAILDVDAKLTLASQTPSKQRVWKGILREAEVVRPMAGSNDGRGHSSTYCLRLVPKLWRLTQKIDHRIFQRLTAIDIVEKVFAEHDVKAERRLSARTYQVQDYVVQYGDDSLAIERELTRISQMIESFEGKLKLMRELIAFSTITLRLQARPTDTVGNKNFRLPFPWLGTLGLSHLLRL